MDQKVRLKRVRSEEWYGEKEGLELEVTQNKKDPEGWFVASGEYAGLMLPKNCCTGYISPSANLGVLLEEYGEFADAMLTTPLTRTKRDGKTILSFGDTSISAGGALSEHAIDTLSNFAESAYRLGVRRGKDILKNLIKNKKESI